MTPIQIPANVQLGPNSVIIGDYLPGDGPFKKFRSRQQRALCIGARSIIDGAYFNLGEDACVSIGDDCHIQEAFLIAELEIRIGNRVAIGWHATILDADFHPIAPAERMADTTACSPLGQGQPRPPFTKKAVMIEDDVWVGPNAVILKGVHIGKGALIEPGAVVTHDVAPNAHVLGNTAQLA